LRCKQGLIGFRAKDNAALIAEVAGTRSYPVLSCRDDTKLVVDSKNDLSTLMEPHQFSAQQYAILEHLRGLTPRYPDAGAIAFRGASQRQLRDGNFS